MSLALTGFLCSIGSVFVMFLLQILRPLQMFLPVLRWNCRQHRCSCLCTLEVVTHLCIYWIVWEPKHFPVVDRVLGISICYVLPGNQNRTCGFLMGSFGFNKNMVFVDASVLFYLSSEVIFIRGGSQVIKDHSIHLALLIEIHLHPIELDFRPVICRFFWARFYDNCETILY